MKKLLLFLLALPLAAQTVYLPVAGEGYCDITGASNATPIVITVSDISKCGLANGDTVVIVDVDGNYAANSHVKVAGETKHLARKVVGLSGNTFGIQDLTNVDVAGSGSYLTPVNVQGIVFKASAYTIPSGCGQYLNGCAGSLYAAMTDTAAGGRKRMDNPAYVSMGTAAATYASGTWYWGNLWTNGPNNTFVDERGTLTLALALHNLTDGTSNAHVLSDLQNMDQLTGGASCLNAASNCGLPNDGVADYARDHIEHLTQALQLSYGDLSAGELDDAIAYLLNDLPWSQGGIDYTAAAHTATPFVFGWSGTTPVLDHGTITSSIGSTTITGSGTTFVSDGISAGDIIWMGHSSQDVNTKPVLIASVDSETQITTVRPMAANYTTPIAYMVTSPWAPGLLGHSWIAKHYGYQSLCGDCRNYAGSTNGDFTQNLTLAGFVGEFAKGLAGCGIDSDQRGCLLFQRAAGRFYHSMFRPYLVINGGGQNGSTLNYSGRVANAINKMLAMLKYGVVSGPDYSSGTTWAEQGTLQYVHSWLPGELGIPQGEPSAGEFDTGHLRTLFTSMYLSGNVTSSQWGQDWLLNRLGGGGGYWAANINYNNRLYVADAYIYRDPGITTTTPPTTDLGENNYDACVSLWDSSRCTAASTRGRRGALVSRTGWSSPTGVTVTALRTDSFGELDHSYPAPYNGDVFIARNSKRLLFDDGADTYGSEEVNRSLLAPGTVTNMKAINVGGVKETTIPWRYGSSTAAFVRSVLTSLYTANVTSAERQAVDTKLGIFMVYDNVVASSSIALEAAYFLGLNSCGTITSSSCVSVNRSAKTFSNLQTGAGLLGKAVALTGTIALTTENSSDTNLSYTGQMASPTAGKAMVCNSSDGSTCANGTSLDYVTVWQTSANAGGESLCGGTVNVQTVSSVKLVECLDGSTPAVVAFVPNGASVDSLSFTPTTSGTTRFIFPILDAGVYDVTAGGSPVSGSPFTVTDIGRTIEFDASSAAIVIGLSATPVITTACPMPDGTQGSAYSQTATATGGTPPYTWDISSGALPTGISMNSSGVFSGTPSGTGTATFTLRVTDAAMETDSEPGCTITINGSAIDSTLRAVGKASLVGGARVQ